MARTVVRYFTLPATAKSDIPVFLEKLSRSIVSKTANITVIGDKVRVELYGSEIEIFMSLERIHKLLSSYKSMEEAARSRGRRRTISSDELREIAGSHIPIEILAEILRRKGYYVGLKTRRSIETNASREVIATLARDIVEYKARLSSMNIKVSGSTAKALITLMTLLKRDLEEILDVCLKEGLIERASDGKLVALRPWTVIVDDALRHLKIREATDES